MCANTKMTANDQERARQHGPLLLIQFTQTHYHPSLKRITRELQRKQANVSLDKPHIYVLYGGRVRQRMISGRESEREGEKPSSVLQFIWSFISKRERDRKRDRWRNTEMQGKAEEQKESRDFQWREKKKKRMMFVWNQYVFPPLALSVHICCCSHAIWFYRAMK